MNAPNSRGAAHSAGPEFASEADARPARSPWPYIVVLLLFGHMSAILVAVHIATSGPSQLIEREALRPAGTWRGADRAGDPSVSVPPANSATPGSVSEPVSGPVSGHVSGSVSESIPGEER